MSASGITMKQPKSTFPHQPNSSQVLFRFIFRIVLLSALATLGNRGFGTTFATLLALSAIFCAVVAATRREAMFGPVLTHWDEAAIYAMIGWLLRHGTVSI